MSTSLRRLLPLVWLATYALPAAAQREGAGPPRQDPFARRETAVPTRAIGNYRSHQLRDGVLTVHSTDGATLRIQPWAEGVVRVEYAPARQLDRKDSSLSVVQAPDPGYPDRKLEAYLNRVQPDGTLVRSTPEALVWPQIRLGRVTGVVTVQKNPLRISYQPDEATALVSEAGGAFQQLGPAGGVGVSFRLAPNEHLYGTGSRALPLDRRGRRLSLYNEAHYGYQDGEPTLNVTLPTVLSSRGYLLFFDNHTAGTLDLGATDQNVLEYRGEGLASLRYFIVAGDSYAEILSRYTALTGRQPLPPRWGLGLIQSRFGYQSEPEMYQVARRMRQAGFPLDALVLDLYWFGGTRRQGDFRWEPSGFPDPARMIRRLDSTGVKTILISEPYVMRASRNDALVRRQGLVGRDAQGQPYTVESFWAGPATLLDMYRPATRRWLWQQYDRLKQAGVSGWWTDLGEPENQPADMHYDAGPTRRIHNGYGQAWASILSEGYQRHYPEERLFNLARSGWAGMQRHATFPWSGDVSRSWGGLRAQVPIMLSMGLGGVGYMHSDAGGFAQGTADPELYTRWLQMAALGPVLRPHGGGNIAPEPYWWPAATQDRVRAAVRLRYQLLPYLYSLAWENSQTGTPLLRPMNYEATYAQPDTPDDVLLGSAPAANREVGNQGLSAEERAAGLRDDWPADTLDGEGAPAAMREKAARARGEDPAVHWNWSTTASSQWGGSRLRAKRQREFQANNAAPLTNVNDQFFLGPNLLVAPVLQPGQRRRNVVLPAGTWIDFYSHETLPGNRTVGRPAPLQHVPLLVRAGAFLPMTRYRSSTALYRADTLQVRYYADATAGPTTFTVYDDDGRSTAAGQGARELLTLQGLTSAGQARIVVGLRPARFAGAPARRVVELLIPRVTARPTAVQLGPRPLDSTAWYHDAAAHTLHLRVALDAQMPLQVLTVQDLQLDTTPARHTDAELLTLEAPDNRSFRGGTTLRYTLHQAGAAGQLRIVDSRGAVVRTLPTAGATGAHALRWDAADAQGRPVPGGVYWAELAGQRQRLIVLP